MTPFRMEKTKLKKQVHIDSHTLNFTIVLLVAILVLLLMTGVYFITIAVSGNGLAGFDGNDSTAVSGDATYPYKQEISVAVPEITDDTVTISARTDSSTDGIYSEFAALIDVTDNKVVASRKGTKDIYPASMTKVMTLIVAIENLKTEDSMNDKIVISSDVVEDMVAEGASGIGFEAGTTLTVRDLLYALILKSDGVAAISLAEYVAGSESAFVDLMNAKAEELGMEDTVFKNCTGLHEDYFISSCRDIGVMMSYAMKNTFCAEILSAYSYRTVNEQFPDGITLYHATLVTRLHNDMAGKKISPNTVEVSAAKSGWTGSDSGYCLVSFATGKNGHKYVLVTAKAETVTGTIEDLLYVYNNFAE